MKTRYHVTTIFKSGKESSTSFDEYNKEKIQREFDARALKLKDGDEVEYSKEDAKRFYPYMLHVVKRNGKLSLVVVRGNRAFYKPYTPKYTKEELEGKEKGKVYTATHTLEKVVKIHTKKIKDRGGKIISKEKTKKGTVLKYQF